jgi:hypothetical protein
MSHSSSINRRSLIKAAGLGALLPMFESSAYAKSLKPPKRVIFIGYGYGHYDQGWFPNNVSHKWHCNSQEKVKKFELSSSLQALAQYKNDVSFISNLSPIHARWPHAGCDTFLTCANPDSNPLRPFTNTVSVDQVIAKEVGKYTRISSMQINGRTGNYDGWGRGASMSCNESGEFLNGLNTLGDIYRRSFGDPELTVSERRKQLSKHRSLLVLSNGGTKSLAKVISKEDKERLSQFTDSLRSIEKRIQKDMAWADKPYPKTNFQIPSGSQNEEEKIKTCFDLMTEIFRTDLTRVISYRMSSIGLLQQMGHQQNTHAMSHWAKNSQDLKCQIDRDKKLAELLAYLIRQLKNTKEIDGSSLLDNTLIFFGTGIRVHHVVKNIPMIMAGGGGIGMKQGKHYTFKENVTPLGNLWLSTIKHFGIDAQQFGDSNNELHNIFKTV